MIIGVNGKIGSGKDTIGKIAQCLINHPKITNKDLLWMIEKDVVSEYSKCEIKKFAGKLKQIASILSGIVADQFEDQEFKKQYMPEEWNSFVSVDFPEMTGEEIKDSDSILVETTYKRMTYREFLQKLGTEAMRDGLHTNVWVNALFADYNPGYTISPLDVDNQAPDKWIITDMRFPNEMDAVKERKGITIRVTRLFQTDVIDGNKVSWIPIPGVDYIAHPSETALDDAKFDYEILNDGSIEDLVKKVKEILIKENII